MKRALERSHSISDFSKQLELSAQKSHFSNNTLKIIEELNNGVKQASEEIKEATKTSNLVKSIREQDTRPFEVVEAKDKEAFLQGIEEKLKDSATPLPKGMSVAEFKQSLESVENKDRFLEHLETRDNSQDRLKFLSLIEPILREPHIEIFIKDKDGTLKKEYIKAFKDENKTRLYMLITQDNDTILRTFIPKLNERYMRSHVRDADIIHSFIQPNRTAKSDNALSDVVVYGDNNTQKPLTDQEDLLKTSENLNETPPKPTHLSPLEQANAKKLLKEQHAITPLKEFGKNYPEFALKPKEALEKLLQEKNGQVAGAAYREDLGGIDFVWGTPKTKDSNGYGLAHILEKREKQYKRLGLTNEQAKERTKELLKQIPEVIEKGIKDNDYIGHATIRHNGIEVGLSSQKGNTPLKNHYMITSFETDEKVLRELETIGTLSNNYRDGINYSTSNLNNPNPTTNALKTQEPLSEQANAKKLLKLESEKGIKAEVLKKLDFDEIKKLIDESPRTGSSMPIDIILEARVMLSERMLFSFLFFLMVNREPNENNPTLKRLIEAVKDMQKESEKGSKKQKLETPSEWGPNYSEFKNDGLGAINKLLETKKGFVAGAFYKEGLGDIDLVWGNKDYGLEHILKRREDQALNKGINETEAKEYAMSVVKTIPEVIEKGVKVERNGRMAIEYQNIRVGLKDNWKGEKLENHWVITGYEKRSENSESLYASPLITKGETLPLNSNKPNPTIKN
ncbi:DUF3519 domain-containing protein [Helicobacter pylori]